MKLNEKWEKDSCEPNPDSSFLSDLIKFEEGDEKPVRSLFPANFTLPSPDSLNDDQLNEKVDQILSVLEDNHIDVEYEENIPPRKVYEYLVNTVLPDKVSIPEKNSPSFVTYGCNGYCPECFQKGYCSEDLSDEWDEK